MLIKKKQIEEGRRHYNEFQKGMSGGFYTNLFKTIAAAKNENIYKMAQGFPGEVYAYREYIGGLDPFMWDIEGETTGEKFERMMKNDPPPADCDLSEIVNSEEFHLGGKPLSDVELLAFNLLLKNIIDELEEKNKKNT